MDQHVCEHLRPVEDHLASLKCAVSFAGQAWSSNCRFWVYYQVLLDCEALLKRFKLPACVKIHVNDDPRSGREKGLDCTACHDAIVGVHPDDAKGAKAIS